MQTLRISPTLLCQTICLSLVTLACAPEAQFSSAPRAQTQRTIDVSSSGSSIGIPVDASKATLTATPASFSLKENDKASFTVQMQVGSEPAKDVSSVINVSVDKPELASVTSKKDDKGADILEVLAIKAGDVVINIDYGKLTSNVPVKIEAAPVVAAAPSPQPVQTDTAVPAAVPTKLNLNVEQGAAQVGCVDQPAIVSLSMSDGSSVDVSSVATVTSSNNSVLSIKNDGGKLSVHPRLPGTATITAKSSNGMQASLAVTVSTPVADIGVGEDYTYVELPPVAPSTKPRGTFTVDLLNLPLSDSLQAIASSSSWSPDLANFKATFGQTSFNEKTCLNSAKFTVSYDIPSVTGSVQYINQIVNFQIASSVTPTYAWQLYVTYSINGPSPVPNGYVFDRVIDGSGKF